MYCNDDWGKGHTEPRIPDLGNIWRCAVSFMPLSLGARPPPRAAPPERRGPGGGGGPGHGTTGGA
jgi:hypothetical protein